MKGKLWLVCTAPGKEVAPCEMMLVDGHAVTVKPVMTATEAVNWHDDLTDDEAIVLADSEADAALVALDLNLSRNRQSSILDGPDGSNHCNI
jgi:hypothetical protein